MFIMKAQCHQSKNGLQFPEDITNMFGFCFSLNFTRKFIEVYLFVSADFVGWPLKACIHPARLSMWLMIKEIIQITLLFNDHRAAWWL
ncbi:hypothetical protein FKM82_010879 [Ascaphus truei]